MVFTELFLEKDEMSSAKPALSNISNADSVSQTIEWNFRAAAHRLNVGQHLQTVLATPYREVHMRIPVVMDDDKLQIFHGFRVQHNSVRGPSLGALHLHAGCDLELQRALAQTATWRCALLDIPFGGSSSGIACHPVALSGRELELVTRRFTARVRRLMGVYEDILAPGENASPQIMKWVLDEYSSAEDFRSGAVTGKSIETGGVIPFEEANAISVAVSARQVALHIGLELARARVVVIGFSKAICKAAQELTKLGCRIVGISEEGWALHGDRGIDLEALMADEATAAVITEQLVMAQPISPKELIAMDCEILLCAKGDSALNETNAASVRARMIVEAADMATTPTADIVFEQHGITVVPDLLAAGGSSIASCLEWEQNLEKKSILDVRQRVEEIVLRSTRNMIDRAVHHDLSLRSAAYCIAVERVARMEKLRTV